jgi:hypothetical protein
MGRVADQALKMDIHQHYQGLLEVFVKCAGEAGFKTGSPFVMLKRLDSKWQSMFLKEGALSMKTDVAMGTANGYGESLGIEVGELEILIHPREQIRFSSPWDIKRSTIELAYVVYDLNANKSDLLLAMHFDYGVSDSGEPDEKHPIFHAQFTHKPIQLEGLLLSKNVDVSRMKGVPEVRLPTAHMTLPSVLLSVAADQFPPASFNKLLRWMREYGPYPHMVNDPFEVRMAKEKNRMRACAWYATLPKSA